MKHDADIASFLRSQSEWLVNLDQGGLIFNLLTLCDQHGLYLIDQDQNLLYGNALFKQMTGIAFDDVAKNVCPNKFKFNQNEDKQIYILSENQRTTLRLATRALMDANGQFAGGIGLVCPSESTAKVESVLKSQGSAGKQDFHGIISRSPAMRDVFRIIQNAAQTEATVLVRGESGAGKELVAKAIHKLSARHGAPFLAVNCAALSTNLLESELFGHVRGAFTGAIKDHSGLFQRANGGTLFLDEVAEMPLELQAKLLRVIQERNYVPVGGNRTIGVDVRIVAATHRSLREEVRLGRFREDLMYRLRVVPIFLPPLRDRREDISLLIWHFISRHNDRRVRVIDKIDPDAMKELLDYRWPGNVRELHNVVEYAFAVGRGPCLRLSELPPEFREPKTKEYAKVAPKPSPKLMEQDESEAIKKALAGCQGHVNEAAALLGMSRATFWRKRKLYRI